MGAARVRARKLTKSGQPTWTVLCFNGAARVRARKSGALRGNRLQKGDASMGPRAFARGNKPSHLFTLHRSVASMGPRAFARGNRARWVRPSMCQPRFNGAARVRARKCRAHLNLLLNIAELQWGRA